MNSPFRQGFEKIAYSRFLRSMGGVGKPSMAKPLKHLFSMPKSMSKSLTGGHATTSVKGIASSIKA